MRWLWLIGPILGLGTPATAAPIRLPSYEEAEGIEHYANEADYARAAADARFLFERIAYRSDGLTVYAYVYRPRSGQERLPVIVFNRGSWVRDDFAPELLVMANRLARAGYVVVAPMYRGSGGAQGRDELGGADLDDLFALLPAIAEMPFADRDRLYLYGESRGGMMVYQALRDGFPARAAAVVGAFSDLDAMLDRPQWRQAAAAVWPELGKDREDIVERRSAVRWANRISAPLLILHGAQDEAVDVDQSLRLAALLADLEKPFQLVVVAGGDHVLSGRGAERDSYVLHWFRKH